MKTNQNHDDGDRILSIEDLVKVIIYYKELSEKYKTELSDMSKSYDFIKDEIKANNRLLHFAMSQWQRYSDFYNNGICHLTHLNICTGKNSSFCQVKQIEKTKGPVNLNKILSFDKIIVQQDIRWLQRLN